MLTRSGVAKKLGRSLATVRRLEGRELFPIVDTRGIHRFPDDQVHRLLLKVRAGDGISSARGEWLVERGHVQPNRRPARQKATAPECDAIATERRAAQHEVALTIVGLLDGRQLRRLRPELIEYLEALLDEP